MIFLPKNPQKRNQLFLALGVVVILIGGMVFGLIRPQYDKLSSIRNQTLDAKDHLRKVENLIHASDAAASEMAGATQDLSQAQADMATGDIYAWTVDTMRHFKANYKVDVPDIGQPGMGDVDLMPNFP